MLRALKERGCFTLMCGDGANDVGALKQVRFRATREQLELLPESYGQNMALTVLYVPSLLVVWGFSNDFGIAGWRVGVLSTSLSPPEREFLLTTYWFESTESST